VSSAVQEPVEQKPPVTQVSQKHLKMNWILLNTDAIKAHKAVSGRTSMENKLKVKFNLPLKDPNAEKVPLFRFEILLTTDM
jgi:hypothetical protein